MKETKQLRNLMEALDAPFIQTQNLSGDDIIDRYSAGTISYEEAEVEIRQLHPDPAEAALLIAGLNNAYGDKEVEWDEETGGGVVRESEGQVYDDCGAMLKSLMARLREELNFTEDDTEAGPHVTGFAEIYAEFINARVR